MTAVEWLENEMQKTYAFNQNDFDTFKQAKELERQEIEKAWKDGNYRYSGYGDSETYYEETFNK